MASIQSKISKHTKRQNYMTKILREECEYICVCVCVCVCVCMHACACAQGLQTTRLLCPWDFPGKYTGVDCHFLLQGTFPIQGLIPCFPSPALAGMFFITETPGKFKRTANIKIFIYDIMHLYQENTLKSSESIYFIYLHILFTYRYLYLYLQNLKPWLRQ